MNKISVVLTLLILCIANHATCQTNEIPFLNCQVHIDQDSNTIFTKQKLLNAKGLTVDSTDITITSFRFAIICKGKKEKVTSNSKNGDFTFEMKQLILKYCSEGRIFLEYLKCIDKNKKEFVLSPKRLKFN